MAEETDVRVAPSRVREPRRTVVLRAAVTVFLRHGYARVAMTDVAAAARVSRQGLYLMFGSKEALFAEAMAQAVGEDLEAVGRALAAPEAPLVERLAAAFEAWTGRYLGAAGEDLHAAAIVYRDLMGAAVLSAPSRFFSLVANAIATDGDGGDTATAREKARLLVAASAGLKADGPTPADYMRSMRTFIALLSGDARVPVPHAPGPP